MATLGELLEKSTLMNIIYDLENSGWRFVGIHKNGNIEYHKRIDYVMYAKVIQRNGTVTDIKRSIVDTNDYQ